MVDRTPAMGVILQLMALSSCVVGIIVFSRDNMTTYKRIIQCVDSDISSSDYLIITVSALRFHMVGDQ